MVGSRRGAGHALVAGPVKGDNGDLVAIDDAAGRGVRLSAARALIRPGAARGNS